MAIINCPECRTEVSDSAAACLKCGFPIKKPVTNTVGFSQSAPPKSPGTAAALNFLWAGVGNIYIGQVGRGIAFAILHLMNLNFTVGLMGAEIAYQDTLRRGAAARAIGNAFGVSSTASPTPANSPYFGYMILMLLVTLAFWAAMIYLVHRDATKKQIKALRVNQGQG